MGSQCCFGVGMGTLGCPWGNGNTEVFWGLGWEGWGSVGEWDHIIIWDLGWEDWGVHRRMGKHHHYLGVGYGNIGVSVEGWEHRVVLGSGMGRLGGSRGQWDNVIILG